MKCNFIYTGATRPTVRWRGVGEQIHDVMPQINTMTREIVSTLSVSADTVKNGSDNFSYVIASSSYIYEWTSPTVNVIRE